MDSYQWEFLATVARASDFPKSGEGPNENALSLTSVGDVLVVMRMDGNDGARWGDHRSKNYYSSLSTDEGKTWTKASEMRDLTGKGIGTARPQLLLLGGSLLLTGSRVLSSDDSDYYLWHDSGGTGHSFDAHSLTFYHNQLIQDPKMRIGVWCNGTNITAPGQQCAGCLLHSTYIIIACVRARVCVEVCVSVGVVSVCVSLFLCVSLCVSM